jgi:hypothetical protein
MPEISESWNGSRPWEHQDPSLLGAERRQAKGEYCMCLWILWVSFMYVEKTL